VGVGVWIDRRRARRRGRGGAVVKEMALHVQTWFKPVVLVSMKLDEEVMKMRREGVQLTPKTDKG